LNSAWTPAICEQAAAEDTTTTNPPTVNAFVNLRRRQIALPVSPFIDMSLFLVAKAATILAPDPQPMPRVSKNRGELRQPSRDSIVN
jgi:hypothetical protein